MLKYLRIRLSSVLKNEEGQGMVEYALIVALIAVVAIVGIALVGPKISDAFTNIASKL